MSTPLGAAVACGPGGLWMVREGPKGFELVEVRDLGGQVVGFLLEDDTLWAKVSHLEAVPVDPAVGLSQQELESTRVAPLSKARPQSGQPRVQAPPPEQRASAPAYTPREGEVVGLDEGYAIVTLGANQGVEPGSSIEFLVEEQLPVPGGAPAVNRRHVAVGVVTRVSTDYSEVRLGINERVPIGAIARLSKRRPTESRVGPPRLSEVWEVGGIVKPFLGLEELGGGFLLSAFGSYRFESKLKVMAALDPLGWADSDQEPAAHTITGYVLAAFDTRLFELGFGIGGQTVNSVDSGLSTGSAALLVQTLRLGSRDGLHLAGRSDVSLFHREFRFSGLTIVGQLPVGHGIWLTLRGAGSNAGYGEGELGIRTLLTGNGDRGSTFLQVALGGAQIFRDAACEVRNSRCTEFISRTSVGGPMGAVGMEWRF